MKEIYSINEKIKELIYNVRKISEMKKKYLDNSIISDKIAKNKTKVFKVVKIILLSVCEKSIEITDDKIKKVEIYDTTFQLLNDLDDVIIESEKLSMLKGMSLIRFDDDIRKAMSKDDFYTYCRTKIDEYIEMR